MAANATLACSASSEATCSPTALACARSKSSDEMDDAGLGDDATYSIVLLVPGGVSRSVRSTTGTAKQLPEVEERMVAGDTPLPDATVNASTEESMVSA